MMKEGKIKILYLEDLPEDVELVTRLLNKANLNFTLTVVTNERDYREYLEQPEPDIILSDHSLPSFDSMKALNILKQSGKRIPFVLVTGTVSEEFAVDALRTGVDDYIFKDRPQRLPATIRSLIQKCRLEKEHEQLMAEQRLLASIINFSDDAIISHTLEGIITSWNSGAERLYNYTAAEIIGKNVSLLFPPDRAGEEPSIIERIKSGEHVGHSETVRLAKGGIPVNISITVSPVKDSYGNIIGASKIARNITGQIKAREELRMAHDRLLFYIENAPLGFIEWDTKLHVKSWSKKAEEIFGWSEGELLLNQKNGLTTVFEDDLPLVLEKLRLLTEGVINEVVLQNRNYTKDKKVIWCEWFSSGLRDKDGNLESILSLVQDITDRRLKEQQLIESEASLTAVIENTDAVIYSLSKDYRYITFNSLLKTTLHQIYGLDIQPGDKVFDFLKKLEPEEARGWENIYAEALTGKTLQFIKEFNFNNAKTFTSFSINPIWQGTEVTGLSCYARDITRQKYAEEEIVSLNASLDKKVQERTLELLEVNKELETFNYTVSHDLQTPLRALSGFSAILIRDYNSTVDEQGREILSIINDTTRKMSELVRNLLNFSKFGKTVLEKQEVDMGEVVRDAINEVKPAFADFKTEIIVHELKPAFCDYALLKQVWVNLIGNAVKYSSKKDKPVVTIGMKQIDAAAVYYIQDNGAGFDMQCAEKLFGVFERLHSSDEFEGTGIGLGTVQRIITRHGGKVWAEGEKGKGATFYFTLG